MSPPLPQHSCIASGKPGCVEKAIQPFEAREGVRDGSGPETDSGGGEYAGGAGSGVAQAAGRSWHWYASLDTLATPAGCAMSKRVAGCSPNSSAVTSIVRDEPGTGW